MVEVEKGPRSCRHHRLGNSIASSLATSVRECIAYMERIAHTEVVCEHTRNIDVRVGCAYAVIC